MDMRAGPSDYAVVNDSSAGAPASEPPRKRQRLTAADSPSPNWTDTAVFHACLEKQVFPHVNHAVSRLPATVLDPKAVATKVVQILTGATTNFAEEYKRGNGLLSRDFELQLSQRALEETRALAKRCEHQTRPKQSPVPLPRPAVFSHSTPQSHPTRERRLSTTPIPVPSVPPRLPNGNSALRYSTAAGRAEEPIIIKDDDEVEYQPPKSTIATPTVATSVSTAVAPRTTVPKAQPVPPARTKATAPVKSKSKLWDASKDNVYHAQTTAEWFCKQRPYLSEKERRLTLSGAGRFFPRGDYVSDNPTIVHVDFSPVEIEQLRLKVRSIIRELKGDDSEGPKDAIRDLRRIWRKNKQHRERLLREVQDTFHLRSPEAINNFVQDIAHRRTAPKPQLLSLGTDNSDQQRKFARDARVPSLLFRREISGCRSQRSMRRLVNFNNAMKVCQEDDFELRAEWTGCAGDVITIVWTSNDAFICGATEHSDSHNQQYNKPGNLVLGSCRTGEVKAYPEHRIVRPIVESGENSTAAMRQTQDPWLYSSVVASDYDTANELAFTSGFDRTVKIWDVPTGSKMQMVGEWVHGGNVNFVTASKDGSGMVATASDVAAEAVRIYWVDRNNISASPYRSFSCSRVTDAEGNTVSTEKWAYFPATMQWGRAGGAEHLLLVGYSPRSRTGDDNDIPEDRLRSGELCLWDGRTGERWKVTAATTQNVFEVMWHPSQKCFIAATSPLGLDVESGVRTQIRVFTPSNKDEYGEKAFSPIQTLDCFAADINELTIMPNSYTYCYVTAGCTDGKTYVWDTARGDRPIHTLVHGKSVEEVVGDREREDVGVKFTAWGTTLDRFYTGSSDGVIKVWNVRSLGNPLVQNLMEAPAPIACGMFSPDKTRLLIGDASGRFFLLAVNDQDIQKSSYQTFALPGGRVKTIRRPTPITRHPEPPPPRFDAAGRPIEVEAVPGFEFLLKEQIKLHPDPTIGAIQGPRYIETSLFRAEAHLNGDPTQPLYAGWEAQQLDSRSRQKSLPRAQKLVAYGALESLHARNIALDLDLRSLSLETRLALETEEAELNPVEDYSFVYEEDTDDEESGGETDEEFDEETDHEW